MKLRVLCQVLLQRLLSLLGARGAWKRLEARHPPALAQGASRCFFAVVSAQAGVPYLNESQEMLDELLDDQVGPQVESDAAVGSCSAAAPPQCQAQCIWSWNHWSHHQDARPVPLTDW